MPFREGVDCGWLSKDTFVFAVDIFLDVLGMGKLFVAVRDRG
jgi:hypothetical protein